MMNMFYRLIILVLLIIGLSLFHTSAYAKVIVCNTMVGDNSTDNSNALNACMKAAQSEAEKTVNIPSAASAYKVSSILTVPEGVSIIGDNGAKLNAPLIRLSNYSKLINLDFSNSIKMRAVVIGEGGPYVTGAQIRDCSFGSASWASVLVYRGNDCVFDHNTFTNGSTGQNLQILGGKRNVITNNTITGGKTGIILKYSRTASGGGFASQFTDNIIMHNTIGTHAEEGISIDSNPATSDQTPELEYDTVASVSGSDITLTSANWGPTGGADPSYVGYSIIPITGSAIGQYRKITVQSNATFTVESAFTGLLPGDGVSIGPVFTGNVIAYNNVSGGYSADRISLYGNCFNNRIEYNDVNGGQIHIKSLDRGKVSDISVTGAGGRAPCGYNLIRKNTTGNINVQYRCHDFAGNYPPYNSYGNAIVDNIITGALIINYQLGYYNHGNTGGFSLKETNANDCGVTISPYAQDIGSTTLDTTDQTYTYDGNGSAPLAPPSSLRIVIN